MTKLYLSSLTISIVLFSACNPCFNVECDAPDVARINALRFRFDPAHFNWNEVDEAIVIRYQKGSDLAVDTVYLGPQFAQADSTIWLQDGYPFNTGQTLDAFDYAIYDNSREYAYFVRSVVVNGYYPTDCCCCYRNKQRTFTLNGVAIDRSGQQDPMLLVK